jgi:hypothetical protein
MQCGALSSSAIAFSHTSVVASPWLAPASLCVTVLRVTDLLDPGAWEMAPILCSASYSSAIENLVFGMHHLL